MSTSVPASKSAQPRAVVTTDRFVAHVQFLDTAKQRHRVDGPAVLRHSKGDGELLSEWWRSGRLHREHGGPAVASVRTNGDTTYTWNRHDSTRRGDGPAFVRSDGRMDWLVGHTTICWLPPVQGNPF